MTELSVGFCCGIVINGIKDGGYEVPDLSVGNVEAPDGRTMGNHKATLQKKRRFYLDWSTENSRSN